MKLRSIQVLRGVAATAVLVCHATKGGFPTGAGGVDLFFIISGFIIGRVMVGRQPGPFLFDRFWRIFPPYWIAAIPWFVLAAAVGQLNPSRTAASLLLWPFYGGELARPYLRPAWSLMFELLFYLSAAVSLKIGSGKPLIAGFLVLMAVNLIWPGPLQGFLGFPLILEFLAGLAIGHLALRPGVALAALPIAFAMLVAVPSYAGSTLVLEGSPVVLSRAFWWGVPAAIFVYAGLAWDRAFKGRWADVPVFIGDASYSIYLTHLTVLIFLPSAWAIPLCLAVGSVFHLLVEKPLLALKPRIQGYAGMRPKEITP